ncbi:trehalose-phosphatase [Microcella frigidaquae]|uniref:Trehalose 6-phosphate phosphatase n=1 Tax=Microcella frigidaquae TaxID=424758 RepID=A0A840XPV3_9MICO|nr:trehalose-phosphatase [Microcella frigidaquae]MBB5618588.1 trehalose 6-phosphate phosphatase [Microcella frigidaquae]NHN44024.1 trehalose-phosphatase [Microcella frigidaquae]
MTGPSAGEVDPELRAAITRVAGVDRLLVALDFDGTLAPEVDDPEAARALPAAGPVLAGLRALPGTTVALVSGRSLASLARVAEVDASVPLIGSHGLELRFGQGESPVPVDAAEAARVAALRVRLEPLVAAVEGAWIEEKPAGFAVHVRRVEGERASRLLAALRAETADERDLTVRAGKNVLEFAVRDATKGDGLAALRRRFAPDAVLFAGDDVTDEDALAVLGPGDVGIKVGAAPTIAAHRVADPASLVNVLRLLMSTRESPGSSR